jgi:hypothetical protein
METIEKIDVIKMKTDIKVKAELQKFYKNQRKTDKIIGERKIPAWQATMMHQDNREHLRVMYAAYGLARGKTFSQIESRCSEDQHPLNKYQSSIDIILNRYKVLVKVEPQEVE